MTKEKIYGIIIFATLVGLLIGFSVAIVLDSYTSKKRKKIFAVIIAMSFVLILQNLISYGAYLADFCLGARLFDKACDHSALRLSFCPYEKAYFCLEPRWYQCYYAHDGILFGHRFSNRQSEYL